MYTTRERDIDEPTIFFFGPWMVAEHAGVSYQVFTDDQLADIDHDSFIFLTPFSHSAGIEAGTINPFWLKILAADEAVQHHQKRGCSQAEVHALRGCRVINGHIIRKESRKSVLNSCRRSTRRPSTSIHAFTAWLRNLGIFSTVRVCKVYFNLISSLQWHQSLRILVVGTHLCNMAKKDTCTNSRGAFSSHGCIV